MWMSAAQMRRTTVILMLCVKTLMVPTSAAVRRVTLATAEIAQVTRVECQQIQIMILFLSYGHRGSNWGSFVILPPCNPHPTFLLLFSSVYMVVHLERFCLFVLVCFVLFLISRKFRKFIAFRPFPGNLLPHGFFCRCFPRPHTPTLIKVCRVIVKISAS